MHTRNSDEGRSHIVKLLLTTDAKHDIASVIVTAQLQAEHKLSSHTDLVE